MSLTLHSAKAVYFVYETVLNWGFKVKPNLQHNKIKHCRLGERAAICSFMFLAFYGRWSFENICCLRVYSVISTPGALYCYEFRILVHSRIVFMFGAPCCISTCSHAFKDHKISWAQKQVFMHIK
jgi:hypothetical protein